MIQVYDTMIQVYDTSIYDTMIQVYILPLRALMQNLELGKMSQYIIWILEVIYLGALSCLYLMIM